MREEVTIEMNDILNYLTDTEALMKKYGTLGDAPSTIDIKSIVNSQFGADDYPLIEAFFQSDEFEIDYLTDILDYFKDSFIDNMKDKIAVFKD